MRCRRFLIVVSLAVLQPFPVFAESSRVVDELLEEKRASFGRTVCLVLAAAHEIDGASSVQQALTTLEGKGWRLRVRDAEAPIRLGEFCYVVMRAFGLRGGIFYSLFPGPRYATREIGFRGFLQQDVLAYRFVSGEEVVRVVGRVLEWRASQP